MPNTSDGIRMYVHVHLYLHVLLWSIVMLLSPCSLACFTMSVCMCRSGGPPGPGAAQSMAVGHHRRVSVPGEARYPIDSMLEI